MFSFHFTICLFWWHLRSTSELSFQFSCLYVGIGYRC